MKYDITSNTKIVNGLELFQIRAAGDASFVTKGELGGWIENRDNLDQEGSAWVFRDASIYGNAKVFGNAKISGSAQVYGNAQISGHARVYDRTHVYGSARVMEHAWIAGYSRVYGNALVLGDALVSGDSLVSGNALVTKDARLSGRSCIMWFTGINEHFGTLTATISRSGVLVTDNGFSGPIEEFEASVKERHGDSDIAQEYMLLLTFIRKRFCYT